MYNCEKCFMIFRNNYDLNRHLSRKNPCKAVFTEKPMTQNENNTQKLQKDTQTLQKDIQKLQKDIQALQKDTQTLQKDTEKNKKTCQIMCEFCLKNYYSKNTLKRHYESCKLKNDPIRKLEIEHEIDPELPEDKNECRFCNLIFARTSTLNTHLKCCKDRERYHKNLLSYKNTIQNQTNNISNITNNNQITNNINNNQIINNNNLILNFGEETMEHITTSDIIRILKEAKDEYREEEFAKIAGEFVCLFDKLLKENPKNKNVTLPCLNSMYAKVKYERGWEMLAIDKVVHRLIKNTSSRLLEQRKEIEEYELDNNIIGTLSGTSLPITPQIFKEVRYLKSSGITTPDLDASIRTSLKLNNIPEKPSLN